MQLPVKTSRLLRLKKSAEQELHSRFADIFRQYRSLAFAGRNDQLFKEHWTPEKAAATYEFAGFEIHAGKVVLHGVQEANGFTYRISIAFPEELVDKPGAIEECFQQQYAEQTASSDNQANPQKPS